MDARLWTAFRVSERRCWAPNWQVLGTQIRTSYRCRAGRTLLRRVAVPHKSDARFNSTPHAPQFPHHAAHRPGRKEQPSRRQRHGTPSAAALVPNLRTSSLTNPGPAGACNHCRVAAGDYEGSHCRSPSVRCAPFCQGPSPLRSSGDPSLRAIHLDRAGAHFGRPCQQCGWSVLPPLSLCALTISLIVIGPSPVPRSICGSVRRAVAFVMCGAPARSSSFAAASSVSLTPGGGISSGSVATFTISGGSGSGPGPNARARPDYIRTSSTALYSGRGSILLAR